MNNFQLNDSVFYTQTGHYVDHADNPLYDSFRGLDHVEQNVLESYPFVEREDHSDHLVDNLYVPFAYNGTSFLNSNIPNIQINHPYPAIGVFYFVLREYPQEFRQQVDGVCVTRDDYYAIKEELNETVERVKEGKGSGARYGMCSKGEMIRIAALFYMVHKTSNIGITEQLEWDQESGALLNPWGGSKKRLYFDNTEFEQYVAKLQDRVHCSAIPWEQFIFSFAEESDENSLWMWNLPDFFNENWFDLNDFRDLFNKLTVIDDRDSYILLTCPKTDEIMDTFKSVLGFERVSGRDVLVNDQFALFDDMFHGMRDYLVVGNYYPSTYENFKRFSEHETAKLTAI